MVPLLPIIPYLLVVFFSPFYIGVNKLEEQVCLLLL